MVRAPALLSAALMLLPLAACQPAGPVPVARVAPPPPRLPASLGRVIGQPAETATALLGPPTLDRREGPARQLQFARAGCVLDLFYYPRAGAGPLATDAAARLADGRELPPATCLDLQLRAREGSRAP